MANSRTTRISPMRAGRSCGREINLDLIALNVIVTAEFLIYDEDASIGLAPAGAGNHFPVEPETPQGLRMAFRLNAS